VSTLATLTTSREFGTVFFHDYQLMNHSYCGQLQRFSHARTNTSRN